MRTFLQSLLGILVCTSSFYLQAASYVIRDLGTLTADESKATGINNDNRIVGLIKKEKQPKAFIWDTDKGATLFSGGAIYQMPLINNCNQVARLFWYETNHWFSSSTYSKHIGIHDSEGSFQDCGAPCQWKVLELSRYEMKLFSDYYSEKELNILAFNDHQQILVSNNAKKPDEATQFAIWQDGNFEEIDSKVLDRAYKMNNQGWILGRKWVEKEGANFPMLVLYHPGEGRVIEVIKDVDLVLRDLNDRGQVAIARMAEDWNIGFLWDPEKGLIELGDFAPASLNNCNQIVGLQPSKLPNGEVVPLLWDSGQIFLLDEMIELDNARSVWDKLVPYKINDNGYIIGQGAFDQKKHAFVLIPQ